MPLDIEWVVAARKFGNKLWNGVRFGISNLDGRVPAGDGYPRDPAGANAWILSRLAETVTRFDELCEAYRFSDAFGLLYNFTWSEVFDWYVEMTKPLLRDPDHAGETRETLGVVLRDVLKLFHPAMPFLTEELWSELVGEGLLAGATWPAPPEVARPGHVDTLQDLVTGVRQFRASHGLSPRLELTMETVDAEGVIEPWWHEQVAALAGVTLRPGSPRGRGFTRIVAGPVQGFIGLEGLIDVDAERARIEKALAEHHDTLARAEAKLTNPGFTAKAPEAVVSKERAKADEARALIEKLRHQLDDLGGE